MPSRVPPSRTTAGPSASPPRPSSRRAWPWSTSPRTPRRWDPPRTQAFELITTGRLAHDGDPVLAEHVANTTALLTERGMKVTKPRRVTPRKNDAAVALVMAVAMAMQEAPKPYVRTPRVPVGF